MNQFDPMHNQPESEKGVEIDLGELFMYLFERLPIILLVTVLCGALAAAYSLFMYNPKYTTTSKIYLVDTEKSEVVSNSDLQLGNSLAKDYLQVFEMTPLKELAREYLGEENEDAIIGTTVTPSNPTGTHILYVNASSQIPENAQLVANAYAEAACDFMEMRMSVPRPTILEQAPLKTTPSSVSRPVIILLGLALGLVVSLIIFTIIFVMDDRIVRDEDINKYFDFSCLGVVSDHNSKSQNNQKKRITKSNE